MSATVTPEPPASSTWEQFHEAGRRRFTEGDAVGAEQAFRAAIACAELPGNDPLQLASSLSSLGQLKYQQKEYTEAEECFRRSLELRERALGSEHPTVISGINNLAALYVARGALDDAEPLLQRAMAVTVRRVESTQAELAVNLNNLVRLYVKRGDYASAEPLLLRLLALKRPLGPDHPDVAAVIVTLAKLRQSMGQSEAAERLWRRVLVVRQRVLPANDLMLASTLDGLAEACAAQGKTDQELGLRERALAIREATPGMEEESLQPLRARIAALRRGGVVASPAAATSTNGASKEVTERPMAESASESASASSRGPAAPASGTRLPDAPASAENRATPPAEPSTNSGSSRPSPIPEMRRPTPIPDIEAITTHRDGDGANADGTASTVNWIEPAHVVPTPVPTRARSSEERPRPKFRIPEQSRRPDRPSVLKWVIAAVALAAAAGALLYLRETGNGEPARTGVVARHAPPSPNGPSDADPASRTSPSAPAATPVDVPVPPTATPGTGTPRLSPMPPAPMGGGAGHPVPPADAHSEAPAIPTAGPDHQEPAVATPVRAVAPRSAKPVAVPRRVARSADTAAEVPDINLDAALKAADQAARTKP